MDRDAEFGAALLEDLEQPAPAHGRKAVAAAGDDLAAVVHVDVVPAGELALHLPVDAGVGVLDAAEGLVGEHHAEAEGVIGRVALPDRDLGGGQELAGQGGEVEPAWPAACDRDAHAAPSPAWIGRGYAVCATIVNRTRRGLAAPTADLPGAEPAEPGGETRKIPVSTLQRPEPAGGLVADQLPQVQAGQPVGALLRRGVAECSRCSRAGEHLAGRGDGLVRQHPGTGLAEVAQLRSWSDASCSELS